MNENKKVVGYIYHVPKNPDNPLEVLESKVIADEFVWFDFDVLNKVKKYE